MVAVNTYATTELGGMDASLSQWAKVVPFPESGTCSRFHLCKPCSPLVMGNWCIWLCLCVIICYFPPPPPPNTKNITICTFKNVNRWSVKRRSGNVRRHFYSSSFTTFFPGGFGRCFFFLTAFWCRGHSVQRMHSAAIIASAISNN